MAKKNVQPANEEVEVIVPDTETKVSKKSKEKISTNQENNTNKKNNKNSKDKNKNKPKKEKKSLKKKATEILSELKKVSKPSFGKVVRNTCVVIVVVAICTLLLFGMDKLFSLIYNWLLPKS